MSNYEQTFDWVQFPEGQARFSGGIRGADEIGHETFAVEINSSVYYGEIKKIFRQIKAITNSKLSLLDILILAM